MRRRALTTLIALATVLLLAAPGVGAPLADRQVRHVDAQAVSAHVATALAHARARSGGAEVFVTDAYRSEHNGVTHVYLRQRHQGLEVLGANMTVNVSRGGEVVHAPSRFVGNLAASARGAAKLGPLDAVRAAARQLRMGNAGQLRVVTSVDDVTRAAVVSAPALSARAIPVKLAYQATPGGAVPLVWNLELEERSGKHWWNASIDAQTGQLVVVDDYVDDNDAHAVEASGSGDHGEVEVAHAAESVRKPVADGSSYRVYALPLETPNDGERSLATDPADAVGSPFGWHDTNGVAGADGTKTRGNNVHAYTDRDNNNAADADGTPDGGSDLDFDQPIDLTQDPTTYSPAATTNLFYWNNLIHDVFYRYGFNEPAGNFQVTNYGGIGLGGDPVQAEAQDGGGTNNASFATPAEGTQPRMQMYLWTFARPYNVTVHGGYTAAGTYEATRANFGESFDFMGLTGNFALVDDGTDTTTDACQALTGFPVGAIALIDRSAACAYTVQVANAQDAGATAAILVNNVNGNPATLTGTDAAIDIPSGMVSKAAGDAIKAGLPATTTIALDPVRGTRRDGDLDAGIIAHEYGHGISNRLTGGPALTTCLNSTVDQEQMGEGWSDFVAMALTAREGDAGAEARGIGTYPRYTSSRKAPGIRPTPYSTDMQVNPATYDTIKTAAVPHGVGYVWATMLWEMYWKLVDKHGFNPDIYADWKTGGNNLAVQLVMDGMKMQPCSPGFADGRNAILVADRVLTDGANQCLIWSAFAKRGLGFSAVQGTSAVRVDNMQAFDMPPTCTSGAAAQEATTAARVE